MKNGRRRIRNRKAPPVKRPSRIEPPQPITKRSDTVKPRTTAPVSEHKPAAKHRELTPAELANVAELSRGRLVLTAEENRDHKAHARRSSVRDDHPVSAHWRPPPSLPRDRL